MEHQEPLETTGIVSHPPNPVQSDLNLLLANGVVTPGVVVGGVLLASDQLLGVEELSVRPHPHLVHHGGLQVHQHRPGHMLPGAGLREEGVEAVVSLANAGISGHHTIRLDPMLQTVELPARVGHLTASLANVDADTFSHDDGRGDLGQQILCSYTQGVLEESGDH